MMGEKKRAIESILGPDPKDMKDEGEETSSLHHCMSEFIDAVHAKDVDGAVAAFNACYAEKEAAEPEGE